MYYSKSFWFPYCWQKIQYFLFIFNGLTFCSQEAPLLVYLSMYMGCVAKAYRLSVYMLAVLSFASCKAFVSAISSARWAEVPTGRDCCQRISEIVVTAAPALRVPASIKLLPSVKRVN